jgi:predicted nucleic acid-binding Zn ribbon protein
LKCRKENAVPRYDYFCEANDSVVEVSHPMNDRLTTWGEVCERAGLAVGDTPLDTPVRKLITGGGIVRSGALKNPEAPPCQSGAPCCGAGACGLD